MSRGLQDVVWGLSAVLNVQETCKEGFHKIGGKLLLATADSKFSKEASIALVLARTLSR
jgi:hypothetical protein